MIQDTRINIMESRYVAIVPVVLEPYLVKVTTNLAVIQLLYQVLQKDDAINPEDSQVRDAMM
jgi:hypothetical protein